ncbi:MAG TPA: GntR family transcriptional regulator, partial [Jiangellaceae bacterium]|nr:GntR family transcriptional regulator [Jiangellaceae bacterium]
MRQACQRRVASWNGQLEQRMKGHLMDELPFVLDRASHRPLADQLAGQLRDAAARGHLRVGERLPSTRALAHSLAVSRT